MVHAGAPARKVGVGVIVIQRLADGTVRLTSPDRPTEDIRPKKRPRPTEPPHPTARAKTDLAVGNILFEQRGGIWHAYLGAAGGHGLTRQLAADALLRRCRLVEMLFVRRP